MIWAHVALSNVASKTGGISFNLVFFVVIVDDDGGFLCVCMTTQTQSSREL